MRRSDSGAGLHVRSEIVLACGCRVGKRPGSVAEARLKSGILFGALGHQKGMIDQIGSRASEIVETIASVISESLFAGWSRWWRLLS